MKIKNCQAEIQYNIHGNKGDWLIIANAPGMTNKFFAPIIKILEDKFKIIIWHYRGISPSNDIEDKNQLKVTFHSDDLHKICSSNYIEKAHFMGWCIGPKVLMDFYLKYPDMCRTFTLLNFSYNVFDDWDEVTSFDKSVKSVAKILKKNPKMGKNLIKLIIEMQEANFESIIDIIDDMDSKEEILDLISNLDEQSNISDLSLNKFKTDTDLINYFIIYNSFIDYYCLDIIKNIRVPTLLISGGKDTWTPVRAIRRLNEMIPNSIYHNIETGSHYLLLEHPQLVCNKFIEFMNIQSNIEEDNDHLKKKVLK